MYCLFWYDGGVFYEEVRDREKSEEGEEDRVTIRTTTSRGLSTDEDQRAEKGQRCRRKAGEEFRTARTQIRWMVDILMRDRFFPTS